VIAFSPVAQQPCSGVKDRLQAIQEALRHADQQTVPVIDLRCDHCLPSLNGCHTIKGSYVLCTDHTNPGFKSVI